MHPLSHKQPNEFSSPSGWVSGALLLLLLLLLFALTHSLLPAIFYLIPLSFLILPAPFLPLSILTHLGVLVIWRYP